MPNSRENLTVDVHVGSRLRLLRMQQGMSQTALGESVGVTFQQIQKYERGVSRISASRLWAIAKALDVNVGVFFEDVAGQKNVSLPITPLEVDALENLIRSDYGVKLCAAVSKIGSTEQRKCLLQLARSMSKTTG